MDLSERRPGPAGAGADVGGPDTPSGSAGTRHPWEVSRCSFFRRLIADSVGLDAVTALLDIGAGDGWFAQEVLADLSPDASVTCWDINYTSDDLNSVLPDRIVRTREQPNGPFDVVLLMDVLEHIENDETFLRDTVVPMLGSKGTLVVSVPAHPRLFTAHDTMLGHHRRYPPTQIQQLLTRSLDVVSSGSLFTALTAVRAAQVVVEKVKGPHPEAQRGIGGWTHGPLLTRAVTSALDADACVGRALSRHQRRLPGLSYWAVCRPKH